jgi:crotonobetainyl-CoA:carnitine CoA-transferase CaiB-like acyl-CoA transferase
VLDYTVNGRVRQPRGNSDTSMVPHGVYRCRGEDEWVAVAVEGDAQWAALCTALGRPDLGTDPRYATLTARWEQVEEIDRIVGEWAAGVNKREAMGVLQQVGVPAGAVLLSLAASIAL